MRYFLIFGICMALFSCQNKPNVSTTSNYEDCDTAVVENASVQRNVPVVSVPQTPQWEDYGAVELWTYSKSKDIVTEDDQFETVESYKLYRSGEGRVYVKHDANGDTYELRYTSNGRNYSYHVAVGNFTVETDDGVMQFNAHAGSHYFDL